MTIRQHPVFGRVVEAMQSAEELGGCEPEDYAALMAEIAREAHTRRVVFLRIWNDSRGRAAARSGVLLLRLRPSALAVYLLVVAWLAVWGGIDLALRLARWFGGGS
jgi:hypothetical protein